MGTPVPGRWGGVPWDLRAVRILYQRAPRGFRAGAYDEARSFRAGGSAALGPLRPPLLRCRYLRRIGRSRSCRMAGGHSRAWDHLGLNYLWEESCAPLGSLRTRRLSARNSAAFELWACGLHWGGNLRHFRTMNPVAAFVTGPSPFRDYAGPAGVTKTSSRIWDHQGPCCIGLGASESLGRPCHPLL